MLYLNALSTAPTPFRYADALKTGDFTAYNAATEAGRLGSLDKCLESAATVRSGLSSFPSGHAAQSTAGLVFAPTYVYYAVPVMKRSARMLKGIALGVPVVLLVIVAGSRYAAADWGFVGFVSPPAL